MERSITADRLTAHLEDLVAARGAPAVLRSDNGPEFISEAMADWGLSTYDQKDASRGMTKARQGR